MTRRLLVSYLGLALLILVTLELPIAVFAYHHERDLLLAQAQSEANGLAVIAGEDLDHGHGADLALVAGQYQQRTGGEIMTVDSQLRVLANSDIDHDNDLRATPLVLVKSSLGGRPAAAIVDDEGEPSAVATAPVGVDNSADDAVVLALPAAGTEGRIHDIWLALVGFALAVLAMTAVVGLGLARSLTRPLARLEAAVGRLGAGDLSARAAPGIGPPEMRALAAEFNQMASRLAELVDAQSRFVADASHQLRSPLTALRLRLENLESDLDGRQSDAVAAAGAEVQRLSRLADGLLRLSSADGVQPDREPADVKQIIRQRADAWSALAEERQVQLAMQLPSGRYGEVRLVPGDLEQILDNLLANALDASPEGARVEVVADPQAARGRVEVHVIDEGPGLPTSDRTRAFDRFWQAPGNQGGHSGLGLAIVRQLAARNDAGVELRAGDPGGIDAVVSLETVRER